MLTPPELNESIAASPVLARFIAALDRLIDPAAPLALAVSGGPDSMALLVMAHAARPGRIRAATVDHRLRPESAGEAAMVAAHCATLGVPHATLLPAAPIAGASLQARAREARYTALAVWVRETGTAPLATAHHLDDQAETFLMRASRGSGLSGLTGIRTRATIAGVDVIRPCIGLHRADLRAVVDATATPWIDDPSNADARYDRVRYRALLAGCSALDATGLAFAAANLAESAAAIAYASDRLWDERGTVADPAIEVDIIDLPREFRRRLALRALSGLGVEAPNIEPLLDSLESGIRATQASVMASPNGSVWRFEPAPPRRFP